GGLTSCCVTTSGSIAVTQWPWPAKWRIVVATPQAELPTSISRRALPRRLPFPDAVFNLQHLALLLGSLRNGDSEGFREALGDRLHQPYRAALLPGLPR